MKKYSVILADPPWKYHDEKKTVREFDYKTRKYRNSSFGGGASSYYQTMDITEICNLQVRNITKDNCALFLWTTFPMLEEAFKVIKSWGFNYKTIGFNWIKLNKNNTPFFGTGYYTRSNSEICLLSIKGRMTPKTHSISSILHTYRYKQNSRKPDIVYKMIESLFDGPYLELFSRRQLENWDVYGLEVDNSIDIEKYNLSTNL